MTGADTNIAALRSGHDSLAELVSGLSDADLAGPSAATEWDISQVLSHLGSGAEIARATVQAALDGQPNPGHEANVAIWDRWNARSGRERADEFLTTNAAFTEFYESLDAETRENLRIDIGFLPAPVDVATAARLRLNELALHSWDVRVAFDPSATLAPEATGPLLAGTGDLIGWIGKADQLGGKHSVIHVVTTDPATEFTLHLADRVSVEFAVPEQPDGTLTLPAESWLRLVAGRLTPQYTMADVSTTGAVDLDLLRRVFPGF